LAPFDPSRRSVDLPEKLVLLAEVEPEAGKIRFLAFEVALHGRNGLGHVRRGRHRFGIRSPAPEETFRPRGAAGRQLKARDARVVPGNAAEAGFRFEYMVLHGAARHTVLVPWSPPEIV